MSIGSRINEMTEHLRNDWNSIDKLGLKAKKLPDEYKQVEYIESSGTQYIDTGFAPNQNTRTIIDFMPTYSSVSLFIFGSRIGYNNNAYDLYTFSNKFRDDYANTNYGDGSSQPFPKSENKRYLFDKNKNHSTMYEDNVQFYNHTFTERTINLSFNMFLFGVNNNGSVLSSYLTKMKLYSCKIYDDDILIRDFVPCYRIKDNEVGLYDTINNVFYTNQGTDVFTYDEAQEEIPNKNIKNIAPVLDRFYNQTSDKTDLAKNGVVGRTSQDGDPTPENPVEINNLSEDVEYKVRGKNKLPFPYTETSHTHNGITYTINDDGTVLVNGTATAQSNTKLYGSYQESNNKEPIGKYLYGGTNEVRIRALNHTGDSYTVLATDTGNGAEIDTTVYKKYYIEISVLQGVTVNNVLIKPMVLDSLDDLKYEPYISESFPLSLKSRNLFDKDNINVINAYISGSKIISKASPDVDKLIYIPCKPNTTYSLQKMVQETTNYNRFRIGTTTDTPALNMTVEDYFNAGDGSTLTNKTITTGANANYLIFYCYREDTLTTFEDMTSSIQIEESSTPTDYEPYYDINLCNISDYKDRIYSQNGEFYLGKKTGKSILNGSENWLVGQYGTNSYSIKIANMKLSENNVTNPTYLIANLFKGVSYDDRTTGSNIAYSETTSLYIRNTNYTSLASFKAMLETTNLIVYYVLTTPTTTEITQENYPTLYSQLLAIQEFLTKYKINKEFLLDYSSLEIEY